MVKVAFVIASQLVLSMLTASSSVAGVERVSVAKVMDDHAIITRLNGESYFIEKGAGCLSLWRFEGRDVLIQSSGPFLGTGSVLIIPELNQHCRIWRSESLGIVPGNRRPTRPDSGTNLSQAALVTLVQRALGLMGYSPGAADGVPGPRTLGALNSYRDSRGFPPTDEGLASSLTTLPIDLLLSQPENPEAQRIARELMAAFLQVAPSDGSTLSEENCSKNRWITANSSDGSVIRLSDGSLWEVIIFDRMRTMLWLAFSRVTVCDNLMINESNSQTARVTRLR